MASLGAEGAAVIRGAPRDATDEPDILHRAGIIGLPTRDRRACCSARAEVGTPALSQEPNGRPIAVAVCRQTTNEKLGLVLWRRRGARGWGGEDVPLVDSIAGIVWLLLERDASQRELRALNAHGPADSTAEPALLRRRGDPPHRAARSRQLPGTLMLAEVDNLDSRHRCCRVRMPAIRCCAGPRCCCRAWCVPPICWDAPATPNSPSGSVARII